MSGKILKIALLGPAKTFSDIAADKFLKSSKKPLKKYFANSIDECFELVEKGIVSYAIVPVENRLNGSIRETLDNLFYKKVQITSKISLPVHHCLVTLKNADPKNIKVIASHSQALNQCQKYLKKKFPKVLLEALSSTSLALQKMIFAEDKSMAVIASLEAAKLPGVKIIGKNIEDETWNSTKFLVIERGNFVLSKPSRSEQKSRTKEWAKSAAKFGPKTVSIAFTFRKNKPGSLFAVFKIFADASINLSKIESRPSKSEDGGYVFYIDFEYGGSPRSAGLAALAALKSIKQIVAKLKILGSY